MTKFVQDDIDDMVKKELIERKKKTEKETDELTKFSDDDMKKLLIAIRNLGRNLKN